VSAAAPGAGTPSGTVTFKNGTTTLGTGTLDAQGKATFNSPAGALSVGSHGIKAEYAGDTNFKPSVSAELAQKTQNAEPVVTPSAAQTTFEGTEAEFQIGEFNDPDKGGPWTVEVNWGDNTAVTTVIVPNGTAMPATIPAQKHTYADNKTGGYTVTVKVTDTAAAADGGPLASEPQDLQRGGRQPRVPSWRSRGWGPTARASCTRSRRMAWRRASRWPAPSRIWASTTRRSR
jgi:hypothetical protein